MRIPIIAANWKMYKTLPEAISYINEIKSQIPEKKQVETLICPPALFLEKLISETEGSDIQIGAQTMHFEAEGAFTGEISPVALKDLGVRYVIIGHSERRQMFNETDETVNKKVQAAFNHQLIPIMCVGETLEQREAKKWKEVIGAQVTVGLAGVTEEQVSRMVIAYEPRWAIGSGRTASAEDANIACSHIRDVVSRQFSAEAAERVRIQYGGSVKPDNVHELMRMPNIDGALVGGAGLDPQSFLQLLEAGKKYE